MATKQLYLMKHFIDDINQSNTPELGRVPLALGYNGWGQNVGLGFSPYTGIGIVVIPSILNKTYNIVVRFPNPLKEGETVVNSCGSLTNTSFLGKGDATLGIAAMLACERAMSNIAHTYMKFYAHERTVECEKALEVIGADMVRVAGMIEYFLENNTLNFRKNGWCDFQLVRKLFNYTDIYLVKPTEKDPYLFNIVSEFDPIDTNLKMGKMLLVFERVKETDRYGLLDTWGRDSTDTSVMSLARVAYNSDHTTPNVIRRCDYLIFMMMSIQKLTYNGCPILNNRPIVTVPIDSHRYREALKRSTGYELVKTIGSQALADYMVAEAAGGTCPATNRLLNLTVTHRHRNTALSNYKPVDGTKHVQWKRNVYGDIIPYTKYKQPMMETAMDAADGLKCHLLYLTNRKPILGRTLRYHAYPLVFVRIDGVIDGVATTEFRFMYGSLFVNRLLDGDKTNTINIIGRLGREYRENDTSLVCCKNDDDTFQSTADAFAEKLTDVYIQYVTDISCHGENWYNAVAAEAPEGMSVEQFIDLQCDRDAILKRIKSVLVL